MQRPDFKAEYLSLSGYLEEGSIEVCHGVHICPQLWATVWSRIILQLFAKT
jgi:hypothetical protein